MWELRGKNSVSKAAWLCKVTSSSSNWRGTSCRAVQHAHISFKFAATKTIFVPTKSQYAQDDMLNNVRTNYSQYRAENKFGFRWVLIFHSKFRDVAHFVWQFFLLADLDQWGFLSNLCQACCLSDWCFRGKKRSTEEGKKYYLVAVPPSYPRKGYSYNAFMLVGFFTSCKNTATRKPHFLPWIKKGERNANRGGRSERRLSKHYMRKLQHCIFSRP